MDSLATEDKQALDEMIEITKLSLELLVRQREMKKVFSDEEARDFLDEKEVEWDHWGATAGNMIGLMPSDMKRFTLEAIMMVEGAGEE